MERAEYIKFKRYHSIENHTCVLTRKMLQDHELANVEWIALEKVHGANFSISTNGEVVTPARRSAVLHTSDSFYNFQRVLGTYHEGVKAFFAALSGRGEQSKLTMVRLYGELYGGLYPRQRIPPGSKAPNRDILYCPHNDWVIFDAQVRAAK